MKEITDYEIMLWIKPYEYGLRVKDGVWVELAPPSLPKKQQEKKNEQLASYYRDLDKLRLEIAQIVINQKIISSLWQLGMQLPLI